MRLEGGGPGRRGREVPGVLRRGLARRDFQKLEELRSFCWDGREDPEAPGEGQGGQG